MYKIFKNTRIVIITVITIILITSISAYAYIIWPKKNITSNQITKTSIPNIARIRLTPTPTPLPASYIIPKRLHAFQTFNNCGPVTLSMALSYIGIDKTQQELGEILRPYQVAGGNNDDKSVTLKEVADEAKRQGAHAYLRPNGDIEKLKLFISNNIPVVTRTWLGVNDDIGHYRLVRGFNETQIIQDDSLQGADLSFTYDDFLRIWQPFNNEYLVIVDSSKNKLVEKILGDELDEKVAWENALETTENELKKDPENVHLNFAMSRIHYNLGNFTESVRYFNNVENKLSFRTLWYQIEPIEAIFEMGDYERLFSLTDRILNNQNRAFSELYYLRGKAYQNLGNNDAAREEFEKAVFYNTGKLNFKNALESL